MSIRSFRGTFLSNFYGLGEGHAPLSILLDGMSYPTVEHAYVAAKLADVALRPAVRRLPKPGQAKSFLKDHGLAKRPDWHATRLAVMEDLVRQKFAHPKLAEMLLATGDQELVEGNTWGDTFWGVDETGSGQNHLGIILMNIREEKKRMARSFS